MQAPKVSTMNMVSQGFLLGYLIIATYFTTSYLLNGDEEDRIHATMFVAGTILWIAVLMIWAQVNKQENKDGNE